MTKNTKIIGAIVLVLAIAAGIWLYADYKAAPTAEAPNGQNQTPNGQTPGNNTQGGSAASPSEKGIIENIQKDWSSIAAILPVKPAESNMWFIDAARVLGPFTVLVAFEDGLNGYSAIVTKQGTGYRLDKFFNNQMKFTQAGLDSLYKEFGDPVQTPTDYERSQSDGKLVKTQNPVFLNQPNKMQVKVALLNTDGSMPNQVKQGDISGCDHVVLVERTVDQNVATLRAALTILLDKTAWDGESEPWGDLYNYANRGSLSVDTVSITNGTAKVYLKGARPDRAGVCDDPRLFVQVAQTARQFSTVQKVELYINGVRDFGSSNQQG